MLQRRLQALPRFIGNKITKTGYTRGAAKNTIYQNRVTRNNTVLIPYRFWDRCKPQSAEFYQNGFIVLVEPSWYFEDDSNHGLLEAQGIHLGANALLLFEHRSDWTDHGPPGRLYNGAKLAVASSRTSPLGGNFLARIHLTVSDSADQIVNGFNSSDLRGAGIRVYEYASTETIASCKLQLEALLWSCRDASSALVPDFMNKTTAEALMDEALVHAESEGLLDISRLQDRRIINDEEHTCCPLCLEPVDMGMFLRRSSQAEGRETYDLTTTEISLFHVDELRMGRLEHRPYNLGWGHHHCNIVVKDDGIEKTLMWMRQVLDNQSIS